MEPGSRAGYKRTEAKIALVVSSVIFSLTAAVWNYAGIASLAPITSTYLAQRSRLIFLHFPRSLGWTHMLSDELLLACGLLCYNGDQLQFRVEQWDLLVGEFQLCTMPKKHI
jgi:hypothetical protein